MSNIKIDKLEGKDRLRLRPAVMLGSAELDGAKHTFIEMLGNSLDEASSGYGGRIDIELKPDYSMRVRDYGRGVPLGFNEKWGQWNFFLIYEELYAGSKYNDNAPFLESLTKEGMSNFKFEDHDGLATVGMNGLGAASSQYTSDWFTVRSISNGKCSIMEYKDGESIWEEPKVETTDEPSGTEISWKPADSVFSNDTRIPEAWMRRQAFNISIVTGIDIYFTGQSGETEFFKGTNIEDFLKTQVEETIYSRDLILSRNGKTKKKVISETKVAIGPATDSNFDVRYYQNFIEVTGGVHHDALNDAFKLFFYEEARNRNVKLKDDDFRGVLTGIVSTRSTSVDFENQTKDSVKDEYIYEGIRKTVTDLLSTEKAKGTVWLIDLADKVIEIAENRLASEEIRKRATKIAREISTRRALPEKFVSCSNYDKKKYADVELWIPEGDSAAGGIKLARDSKTQACFPVRGKGLNLYRATLDKLLANKEVLSIMQILGTGIDLGEGVKHDKAQFDIKKLRVGKIIFATDADKDGYHIRMLLTVLFWRLFPELLEQGYVYIAESPIVGLKKSNGKYERFFYTNEEWDAFTEEYGDSPKGYSVERFKGLGQMDATELSETTVLPGKRRLVQVKFDPTDQHVLDTLLILFGNNTDARKRAVLSQMLGEGNNFEDVMLEMSALSDEVTNSSIEDVREVELITL